MVSSRRSRVLALSAILLTLVFIFITTHKSDNHLSPSKQSNQSQQGNSPPPKISTGIQGGGIDEKFIKSQEDKLKQDIQKAKDEVLSPEKVKDTKSTTSKQNTGTTNKQDLEKTNKVDSKKQEVAKEDQFDPAKEFSSIMSLSPVIIFSKTYCGYSKALKDLLKIEYEITPSPTIIELDYHDHGRELQDYLAEKSGRKTVPNLFINGISRGGSDEIKKLHAEGKLLTSLSLWGDKNIKVEKISAPSNS